MMVKNRMAGRVKQARCEPLGWEIESRLAYEAANDWDLMQQRYRELELIPWDEQNDFLQTFWEDQFCTDKWIRLQYLDCMREVREIFDPLVSNIINLYL